jgi:triacylglycerol lipase
VPHRPVLTVLTALAALALLAVPLAGPVDARPSPRTHEPVPQVSRAAVAQALHCSGNLRRGRKPVLFLHGTTSSAVANWSWNWDRALDQRQWAHCDLQSPDFANGDIQLNGEYVVQAVRIMRHRAGRRISIVGHSQGGMVARWAFKYWPSTRAMVDDYVGLSSSNHGTNVFSAQCTVLHQCTPASWQQQAGSAFLAALNAGTETYPQIDYTEISTHDDEIVVPSTSPYLTPGPNVTNVAVQDLCPSEVVDHFGMAYDNAAWLIGLDALTHRGPAVLARIPTATCGQLLMPGVDPTTFAANTAAALAQTAASTATSPTTASEPPLRSYAR